MNSIKPAPVLQAIFLTPKGQYGITTMPKLTNSHGLIWSIDNQTQFKTKHESN